MAILNFKGAIKPKVKSAPIYHIIIYKGEQWFVRILGNLIHVLVPNIRTATVLYSLPSNDKHEAWTKTKIAKGAANDIAYKSWSTLYHGMRVQGYIKNNEFIITKIKD
jgi:hypothetical protein